MLSCYKYMKKTLTTFFNEKNFLSRPLRPFARLGRPGTALVADLEKDAGGFSRTRTDRFAVGASSRELANPRWSVGCECLDREYADFSAYKPYVGELGVGAARIQSGWARCEQKKGKYEFGWLDEAVDGLCEQGIRPWMCLAYGNPVYGAQKSLGSRIFTDEETLRAWERYVTAVARRYKGRVSEWEVWNEPNLRGADQSAAYAELLIARPKPSGKVDPEAVIIGFGLSRMPLGFTGRVLDIVRERGKLDLIDYVSFHPYYENPDDATPGIEALAELVASYDPRIRLFSGESGCRRSSNGPTRCATTSGASTARPNGSRGVWPTISRWASGRRSSPSQTISIPICCSRSGCCARTC